MRCTDCNQSKETIPSQVHYIYCTKFEKEMSTATEFETCQYKQTDEYKLKKAIQEFCNDEKNWIVAVEQHSLFTSLKTKFSVPNIIQDIKSSREFEKKVFEILAESNFKIDQSVLVSDLGEGEEERDTLLILQKPK